MNEENVNEEVEQEVIAEQEVVVHPTEEEKAKASISTKETKEAMRLVFAFIKVVKEAKENDGQLGATDLALLVNLFPHVSEAIDGIDKVIPELKDLDSNEIKDLLVFTGAQLSGIVKADKELVEKALKAAIAVVELVALIASKK